MECGDIDLWKDVEEQLERQRKPSDGHWLNFLNRMCVERCGEANLTTAPSLDRKNCSISVERWAPKELRRVAVLHHCRAVPTNARRPIFVRYMNELLVIDGNNRVVQWSEADGVALCDIIVLTHPPASASAHQPSRPDGPEMGA